MVPARSKFDTGDKRTKGQGERQDRVLAQRREPPALLLEAFASWLEGQSNYVVLCVGWSFVLLGEPPNTRQLILGHVGI